MSSLAGAIHKHLTTARSAIETVDRLLQIGNPNKKLARLCDQAAMTIGSLQVLIDGEKEK